MYEVIEFFTIIYHRSQIRCPALPACIGLHQVLEALLASQLYIGSLTFAFCDSSSCLISHYAT